MRIPSAPPRGARRTLAATALALSCCLLTPSAQAEGVTPERASQDELKDAQAAYAEGVARFQERQFEAAANAFERSLAIVSSPNARLMLARALRDAGDTDRAFEQMAQTLRDAGHLAARAPRYAAARDAAEAELAELRPQVAALNLEVTGGTVTELWVGDRKVLPQLWSGVAVSPGVVHVVGRLPGGRRAWRAVEARRGELLTVTLDVSSAEEGPQEVIPWLKAGAGAEGSTPGEERPTGPRDAAPLPYRELSYIAAGVAGVGLLTFGVAGLMSQSTYGELEDQCPDHHCDAGYASTIDRGRREQTIANVGLGVGVVGLVSAAVFYFLDASSGAEAPRSARAGAPKGHQLTIGAGSLSYQGSF
ncbi:MAG: hypothetical protein KIT72_15100 [Polyangiaceae bacterium]|nr:hypothetical protein [Polyangiaceae bacterium]MCW5791744.1 hypothetical protein [Polyangiaceae bacterium]